MKKIAFLVFAALTLNIFGQTDKNGNPVFNNDIISEEKIDNFELTSGYYNIKENISNKKSSVFVSEKPTLDDYLNFSRDLPSYCFIIHRGEKVIGMIILLQTNKGSKTTLNYKINFPSTGKRIEQPCNVWGEISEKRVSELESIKVDKESNIMELGNGNLYFFNGVGYRIQPYDKLKAEVDEISKQIVIELDKTK